MYTKPEKELINTFTDHSINTDEIQEIITAVPIWIVRWGIALVFAILIGIILLSALINYPDVVKASLKVNSLNSPKIVLAGQSGKIVDLLVEDGQSVKQAQVLAYLESTGNPADIILLSSILKKIQLDLSKELVLLPSNLNLGELQGAYQSFYLEFLQYQSTKKNGFYIKQRAFLKKQLQDIDVLKNQIIKQTQIQQQEYLNFESEYKSYQKLYQKKVISHAEFVQQENKYLASKYPLQQSETSLLNNAGLYSAKKKELLELEHTISEQESKFLQALNKNLTEIDSWILKHVLRSPVAGRVGFAGIIQRNQNVVANQEVFIVNPGNTDFFGEIQIPQYNMGKIQLGQKTLVRLRSFPYEQYGMIRGKLNYISEVAYRDSVFIAKVSFESFEDKEQNRKIVLKNGMQGEAEIITEESSLLQRFFRSITKVLKT